MRFLNKGGSGANTNDATATADDILSPQTAYVKGEKITGNIIVNSTTEIGGLTYKSYVNNKKIIYDYNDQFKIAISSATDSPSFDIYHLENNTLGDLDITINYDDIGISGYTNDISITNIEKEENTAYIWLYVREKSGYSSNNLKVAILKYNTVEKTYTLSKIYKCGVTATIQTTHTNGNLALNPSDNFIGLMSFSHNNNMVCRLLKYSMEADTISELCYTTVDYISGDPSMCQWNEAGNLCVLQSINNKGQNRKFGVFRFNDTFDTFIEVIRVMTEPLLPVAPYKNYYFWGNVLYDLNNDVVKTYTFKIDVTGFIWTYKQFLFVNNLTKLNCYMIKDDLELTLLYSLDVLKDMSNKYEYGGTALRPVSNKCLYYADYDGSFYSFIPEDETITINSLTRKSLSYNNTYSGTCLNDDILADKIAFSQGKKLTGTMPNNGELIITPTDIEQLIPLGYTSGGIVEAADITTLQNYNVCLGITNAILKSSDYTIINFIRGKNGPYIDTGIIFDNNTEIELDFKFNSIVGYDRPFGAEDGINIMRQASSNTYIIRNSSRDLYTWNFDMNTRHKIKIGKGNIYIDDSLKSTYTTSISSQKTMFLHYSNLADRKSDVSVYSFKIWENSELVKSFVPVLDKNLIPCYYDEISKEFYYNIGSSEFSLE